MTEDIFSIRLIDVKRDIFEGVIECNKRGLIQSAKWLSELSHGLSEVDFKISEQKNPSFTGICTKEFDNYNISKSYFDCKEYDRSAYFTRNCESPVPKFLHLYATYMSKEKKRVDNMTENTAMNDNTHVKDLTDLLTSLKVDYNQRKMDGYCLYLYGVVLKKLDLVDMAITIFIESVNQTPTMWGSWIELSTLIPTKEKLNNLNLPNHWMKHFFTGHTLLEQFMNDDGLKQFEDLQAAGFSKCIYVTSQIALAYHNKRDVEKAIEIYQHIQEVDPFRLDNLDIYSNLLFVKQLKTEMAFLAHKAAEINKYRPETCCVIGNYYSIRDDHQKAITYFQRALKLNPQYLAAWTLMGHEFMEMKNTNAAIQSYRQAVEVNRRDFRAWYGLGQTYEILKMPFYSLYYYKIARQLRPYDSRMLVALGETYEKLEKNSNALKCYQKAYNVGDIEGIALWKLASLYEKLGDIENAVPAFLNYCADEGAAVDKTALCHAFITLGNYYENIGNYEEASHFAYKCLEHDETKSEAKALLKTITVKRSLVVERVVAAKLDTNSDTFDNNDSDMIIENETSTDMMLESPTQQQKEPREETPDIDEVSMNESSFLIE